jgi:hypothetical protein
MKLKNIKKPLILGSLVSVALTGCLKDNYYDTHQSQAFSGGTTQVISLGLNVTSADNVALLAYNNSDNDTTVNLVPVELGGPNAASQDVVVTLENADDIVDSTNTADGSDFALNTGQIVIPSFQVTIPAGQRIGYLKATFKPSSLIGTTYGLGFRIVSVAQQGYVIGNLSHGMAIVLIKNKYDGKYRLTQKSVGWGAYSGFADGVSYVWPSAMGFRTKGALTNGFENPSSGILQPMFLVGGGTSALGATDPAFTFDASDKLVSVTNDAPDDGRGRQFVINPAVTDSRYDPATKTIYMAYIGRFTYYRMPHLRVRYFFAPSFQP